MARTFSIERIRNTRLYVLYSLVFLLWTACGPKQQDANGPAVVYTNGKATGIKIPANVLKDIKTHPLRVTIPEGSDNGILGTFTPQDGFVLFESAIPLTPGQTYSVIQGDLFICKVTVEVRASTTSPKLLHIYPETDTLPENALKLYLHFATPMRTGNSLDHVYLLDKSGDTLQRVFLNLQPELWDTTGTVLTLWIDPGRIKRDLVLNRQLGNPLKRSESYQLVIKGDWKDSEGRSLPQTYTKSFVAAARDDDKPDMEQWRFDFPEDANTRKPISIALGQPHDHYLLQEAITVLDANGQPIAGTVSTLNQDRTWRFTPTQPWKAQDHKLRIAARLEDLAGNNLNRVFDRDITKATKDERPFYEGVFVIQ